MNIVRRTMLVNHFNRTNHFNHFNLAILAILSIFAISFACAGLALAGDPIALIVEGGTAPGLPAEAVITSLNNTAVNSRGGYGFNLNYEFEGESVSALWGHLDGGAGDLIRQEGYFAPYTQNTYESFWGMGLDAVSYSPSCDHDNGATGLDGVWINDTPVAVEEMEYPHMPGYYFSFGSRPGCTDNGVPYFVGGVTDEQGASTQLRGIFYGWDNQKVLMAEDEIPGLPFPLSSGSSISFDYRFSALGSHYLAEVNINSGSTANDGTMILDGQGLLLDGELVREGSPIPASVGAEPGESWDNFDFLAVTESGSYMITGDTDGPTDKDEFLLIDGVMVLREGAVVDDHTIVGAIEGAFMNEAGDWVAVWDVDLPDGENVEAMFFNGDLVLKAGDIIDTDGDGVPEVTSIIDGFTGISTVTLSEPEENGAVSIYFTADVDATGGGVDERIVIAADPEAGLDEDIIIEPGTRSVLEYGYRLTLGETVPTMLGGMDILAVERGVQLNWRMHDAKDGIVLALRARQDGRTWDVPYTGDEAGRFSALDREIFGGEVVYSLYLVDANGGERLLVEKSLDLPTPAAGVLLEGTYPNPFNPETKISFRVGQNQRLQVSIYDVSGNLVNVLADEVYTIGQHEVNWNGLNRHGAPVPSGTYFARVAGESGVQTGKLLLVK